MQKITRKKTYAKLISQSCFIVVILSPISEIPINQLL